MSDTDLEFFFNQSFINKRGECMDKYYDDVGLNQFFIEKMVDKKSSTDFFESAKFKDLISKFSLSSIKKRENAFLNVSNCEQIGIDKKDFICLVASIMVCVPKEDCEIKDYLDQARDDVVTINKYVYKKEFVIVGNPFIQESVFRFANDSEIETNRLEFKSNTWKLIKSFRKNGEVKRLFDGSLSDYMSYTSGIIIP